MASYYSDFIGSSCGLVVSVAPQQIISKCILFYSERVFVDLQEDAALPSLLVRGTLCRSAGVIPVQIQHRLVCYYSLFLFSFCGIINSDANNSRIFNIIKYQ